MRIGQATKISMKTIILRDLYERSETELSKRRASIVRRSRAVYLAKYEQILQQLPDEMISHCRDFKTKIDFEFPGNTAGLPIEKYEEVWVIKFDKAEISPAPITNRGNLHWATAFEVPLPMALQDEAFALVKDIVALKEEKGQLEKFLTDTLKAYSGSKQLEKAWPASLHKYLPRTITAAPMPKPIPAKKVTPDAIAVPDSLNIRLTNNLLEGD